MSNLIERQAAINALYKMLHDCFWADDEELDAVITTLNDLPSAQPEPLKITIDPPTADELKRIKHAMRNTPVMLLPSAQPDNRLSKIADLVEGTIDHFDLDDAMDLLYQIKDVLDGYCPKA